MELVQGERTGKTKKNLYYSFDSDKNLHTYVKTKIKWGNGHELFSIFFIEDELFTENVRKGVRGNEYLGFPAVQKSTNKKSVFRNKQVCTTLHKNT